VTVPLRTGPCPSCGAGMDSRGRSWHLALLCAVPGGVFAMVLLFVTPASRDPRFLGLEMSAATSRLLGAVLAAVTLAACIRFLLQRLAFCRQCSISILAYRRLKWTNANDTHHCVLCGEPMRSGSSTYRLTGALYALVLAFFLIGGPLLWLTTGSGFVLGGLGIAFALAAFGYPAIQRFRLRALRCSSCGVQIILPPRDGRGEESPPEPKESA